ncbi:hypothetical protein SAMD00019534_066490 [Acytostelium subglobosum LB1]|uniref:hypothetical protein n=1 Tax=Acytostelium subglobosum LB1 TaxID=1410327 RepID=UPI00064520B3|nr:hypothetical protein SAMD00019534_066490 [Acytostelium subglobosum LB1]GAM23474.1 hypothetical protein SAMD00019534_066490 [Acytostelium subglobosum LB1]|eukprot:XP_012753923.1 hypothetical protein SAMD00019534_066490 [Acytostelium subglobosum LB1]
MENKKNKKNNNNKNQDDETESVDLNKLKLDDEEQEQEQEQKKEFIDDSWLSTLKLAPSDYLTELDRAICPQCKKKRKYFCYDCYVPFGEPGLAPKLKLPIKCDILHYPTELLSKSTAIHSKVIAFDDVSIHEFPEVPDYNVDETVLLYPSATSEFVRESDLSNVKRVVFIDSQWHTANRILRDPRVKKLRCIKIDQHKTLFWRYQQHGDAYLATIEAIYYFYRELHMRLNGGNYDGQYDNLLFYYTFFYNLIQKTYKQGDRNFWRKQNYIKPAKDGITGDSITGDSTGDDEANDSTGNTGGDSNNTYISTADTTD